MAARFDLVTNTSDIALTPDQLGHAMRTADAVCPTVTDKFSAEVFDGETTARIIGNFGVGYNHIDMDAARNNGLLVTNTPDVLTDCTADITMTLLLMSARRASEGERALRAGDWHGWYPTHLLGTRVSGKRLGIIGMGRIGQAVAHRAHFGFGMAISYNNRASIPDIANAVHATYVADVDTLFAECDFVSLHCPSTPQTRHLVNEHRLSLMGPNSFLINTARGDVVDEQALAAALSAGQIGGAGLDVYEHEPDVAPALLELDNVTLLPHLGSGSRETRVAMGMRVFDNLAAFFDGREPPDRLA